MIVTWEAPDVFHGRIAVDPSSCGRLVVLHTKAADGGFLLIEVNTMRVMTPNPDLTPADAGSMAEFLTNMGYWPVIA